VNRRALVHPTVFSDFFSADNARFGAYYSQDYFDARLKLNVKPWSLNNEQFWRLEFNFHRELSDDDIDRKIADFLDRWEDARKLSRDITDALHGV
jgi:hypothetical protein